MRGGDEEEVQLPSSSHTLLHLPLCVIPLLPSSHALSQLSLCLVQLLSVRHPFIRSILFILSFHSFYSVIVDKYSPALYRSSEHLEVGTVR